MTTKITVEPAGHVVRVTVRDDYKIAFGDPLQRKVEEYDVVLRPGDAPWSGYATTTRTISVVDLDVDPAAPALTAEAA